MATVNNGTAAIILVMEGISRLLYRMRSSIRDGDSLKMTQGLHDIGNNDSGSVRNVGFLK